MKKVLIANSNVASNVGNDFFYKGIKYALKKVAQDLELFDGYFSPLNAYGLSSKEEKNNLDYFSYVGGVDGLVIAGPVLDVDFSKHFELVMSNAKKLGKKIIMLSVGGRTYDDEEFEHCRSILKKYPPDIFISRDSDTFNAYHDLALNAYDGICFATFAPDYYLGYETPDLNPYIVSCFDFAAEPDLNVYLEAYRSGKVLNSTAHTTKSRIDKFKHVLQRRLPTTIDEYKVIRTCHRPIRNGRIIFNKPNMLSSFTSDPFLNLYKNTEFTVTDRLHAAVVTMAFGNSAYLALKSNRTRLLDRAGMAECKNGFYSVNMSVLGKEKTAQLEFLRTAVEDVNG